jgi:hypothetical protein
MQINSTFLSLLLLFTLTVSTTSVDAVADFSCNGHWVKFHFRNCSNPQNLLPMVVSDDGLTQMTPVGGGEIATLRIQRRWICVNNQQFTGHAYLACNNCAIQKDGSNAQNVTFTFQRYPSRKSPHVAFYAKNQDDEAHHAGDGPSLLSAGEYEVEYL